MKYNHLETKRNELYNEAVATRREIIEEKNQEKYNGKSGENENEESLLLSQEIEKKMHAYQRMKMKHDMDLRNLADLQKKSESLLLNYQEKLQKMEEMKEKRMNEIKEHKKKAELARREKIAKKTLNEKTKQLEAEEKLNLYKTKDEKIQEMLHQRMSEIEAKHKEIERNRNTKRQFLAEKRQRIERERAELINRVLDQKERRLREAESARLSKSQERIDKNKRERLLVNDRLRLLKDQEKKETQNKQASIINKEKTHKEIQDMMMKQKMREQEGKLQARKNLIELTKANQNQLSQLEERNREEANSLMEAAMAVTAQNKEANLREIRNKSMVQYIQAEEARENLRRSQMAQEQKRLEFEEKDRVKQERIQELAKRKQRMMNESKKISRNHTASIHALKRESEERQRHIYSSFNAIRSLTPNPKSERKSRNSSKVEGSMSPKPQRYVVYKEKANKGNARTGESPKKQMS